MVVGETKIPERTKEMLNTDMVHTQDRKQLRSFECRANVQED